MQGTQPLPQGSSFQVVNRQYDRSRSPSVEITGDQAGQTPPPPTPPTPPGEKQYEEYEYEDSPPYSTRSNFMGFSPLQGQNDTPLPPSATPGQVAMNLVEDSAKDLETVLNVAETGVKSLLSRIRAGEKVVATAEAPSAVPPVTTNNNNNNDIDAILHDILEEEFNHPPINTSIGEHRQYHMETENMYNELLDHNNTPLVPPTPPPVRKKPMARIAHKPPMPIAPVPRIAHKPPMPIASPPRRIAHKPPMPIASPPPTRVAHKSSSRNTKIKNAGTQVGNDRGVHNTLNDIFHDFCEGRKNTRQATHKILDIVHQISKDNIR